MILGIGTDIVRVARMHASLQRFGDRFARRILNAEEWDEYRTHRFPARLLAKRFAAKEAAAKALGTGFRDGLAPGQIAVVHDSRGQPAISFAGEAAARCERLGVGRSLLSITDERDHALAVVMLLRG